ncbi:MAG: hypothetical protein AAFV72_01180 [Cyanobacteria bacterium J06635_1]
MLTEDPSTLPLNSDQDPLLPLEPVDSFLPPVNPYLADSPWPVYHLNSYAQASTHLRGPEPGDLLAVETVQPWLMGGVSPWTLISEQYPNGERVAWGATTTHVFKLSIDDDFSVIDRHRIDFNPFSVHWNLILLAGNQVLVPDPGERKFYLYGEADPSDPNSEIVLEDTFELPEDVLGSSAHVNVAYDGWTIFTTDEGYVGAISPDFDEYRVLELPQDEGEINYHNAFSIDEEGGIYIVTTDRMLRVNWQNQELSLGWEVPYDFRGPGCEDINRGPIRELFAALLGETCTGSGTTPTLMGVEGMDELVLVADGHSPNNNMVALWRDQIPDDWVGLPGHDRRVAAVVPLPYSTPDGEGFTAENSPVAWGYDIAIAQYNGLTLDSDPLNGVQKLRWSPESRTLDLVWSTDTVNFNNVLTYSDGSDLVYGTGRQDANYYFWGLDWETGEIALEVPLGDSADFTNQGNQITLNEDRSIVFGAGTGAVQIRPISSPTSATLVEQDALLYHGQSSGDRPFSGNLGDNLTPSPDLFSPANTTLTPDILPTYSASF